jgi:hypothetical protein
VKYSCKTCQKTFTQKGHLEDHHNRKHPCKKDNTIEALVEQKVKEALSKKNEGDIKNDTTASSQMLSSTMNYTNKTREELIVICKEKSIKGYSGKKKSEILILLENKTAVVSNDSHDTENIIVSNSVELEKTLTTKFPMPQYLGSKTKYIEHI